MKIFEEDCKLLELATIVLDQVFVWEEEDIRVLKTLVHVSVRHQLLISESLVCLVFLDLGHYLSWNEIHRLCYCLGDNELELSDCLIHVLSSLKRSHY